MKKDLIEKLQEKWDKPQHTPTPWIVVSDTMRGLKPSIMNSEHTEEIALLDNNADAAYIVRAVNRDRLFEELLRVCKMIYESENEQDKFAEPWMIELGEAIAKAEGK